MVIRLPYYISVSCYRVVTNAAPGRNGWKTPCYQAPRWLPGRQPVRWLVWQACRVTAGSPQREGAEWFSAPAQLNHRRYEALRAWFTEGLTYEQAAQRFGYTRWAMVSLVREFRAGKLDLFAAPRKPGPPPGTAPAKDRARGRVIELRRQGLSTYEISARLAAEGRPLNRTSVGEILAGEGFGRLVRGPQPAESISPATPGRDTRLPRASVIDFGTWPAQLESTRAGLLLVLPDLVNLDLPALARPGRLPRHPHHPRGLLAAVPAGAQAHQHPAGLPRR